MTIKKPRYVVKKKKRYEVKRKDLEYNSNRTEYKKKRDMFFNKYMSQILDYSVTYLFKDPTFVREGVKLYGSEEKLSNNLRVFRSTRKKSKPVKLDIIKADNIKKIVKTKTKVRKINTEDLTDDQKEKLEQWQKEEEGKSVLDVHCHQETITENIKQIAFSSEFTKKLYPLIERLIDNASARLDEMNSENITIEYKELMKEKKKQQNEQAKEWQKKLDILEKSFDGISQYIKKSVMSSTYGVQSIEDMNKAIYGLSTTIEEIEKIEKIMQEKSKLDIEVNLLKTKELNTFVESLVKIQLVMKGAIDNDISLISNGYVKRDVTDIKEALITEEQEREFMSILNKPPVDLIEIGGQSKEIDKIGIFNNKQE